MLIYTDLSASAMSSKVPDYKLVVHRRYLASTPATITIQPVTIPSSASGIISISCLLPDGLDLFFYLGYLFCVASAFVVWYLGIKFVNLLLILLSEGQIFLFLFLLILAHACRLSESSCRRMIPC